MKYPSVYIIILVYKNYSEVLRCIYSIQNISYPNYSLLIIDNASPDEGG